MATEYDEDDEDYKDCKVGLCPECIERLNNAIDDGEEVIVKLMRQGTYYFCSCWGYLTTCGNWVNPKDLKICKGDCYEN